MKAAETRPARQLARVRVGPFELRWPSGESAGAAWTRYSIGLVVLALPIVLLKDSPYFLNLLILTYVFAGLASAWNIIGGFGGQFSLGHGVFFATGAYVVAILFSRYKVSP